MSTTVQPEYVTPPTVARRIGVADAKVIAWINSGELCAVDLATVQGGRPRWRIRREDFDAFLQRRAGGSPQSTEAQS